MNFNDFLILQNNYNHALNANGSAQPAAKSAAAKTGGVAAVASSAVKLTASGSVAAAPTVQYILSKNDNGSGVFTPGSYAVYAVDSTGDNAGMAAYEFDIQGWLSIRNRAPTASYTVDDGSGGTFTQTEGFSAQRTGNNIDPVAGTQDTTNVANGTVMRIVYGFGQTSGNLDSGSASATNPSYGVPLLLAIGTFTGDGSALVFNASTAADKSNVFLNTSGIDTQAANVTLTTQTVSAPEPATLSLLALAAGGMLGRRRRKVKA